MKKNWLTIALVIFTLLIVILADSGKLPRFIRALYDFPYGDKVGHFLLMGFLSYALNWTALTAYISKREEKRDNLDLNLGSVIWTMSLFLAFFVTLEELSQQFFLKRTFSLCDLIFSYAGIAFFGWLAGVNMKKKCSL